MFMNFNYLGDIMGNLKIIDIQNMVDVWIKSYGDGYWNPLSMLAALVEEVGELARVLNSIEGGKGGGDIKLLSEEIGDVFFALVCLSNYYDINLEDAIKSTIDKYTVRDSNRWIKR